MQGVNSSFHGRVFLLSLFKFYNENFLWVSFFDPFFLPFSSFSSFLSLPFSSITPRLLKESASAISGPLAELMNELIKQCKYPSRWKMGQVTPLFKKNDELSKEHYRPSTVLPALNNVFEKLLASQLDQFYSEILSDYISAYRRHYSCETSLMRLTEDWKRSLDNKQIVAVISMDLSKAFDTIPHGLLLAKLKAYGVNSRSCICFLKIRF